VWRERERERVLSGCCKHGDELFAFFQNAGLFFRIPEQLLASQLRCGERERERVLAGCCKHGDELFAFFQNAGLFFLEYLSNC